LIIIYIIASILWVLCGFIAYGYHKAYTLQQYAAGDPETSDEAGVVISLAVSWFYCHAAGGWALIQVFRKGFNVRGWYHWIKTEDKEEL